MNTLLLTALLPFAHASGLPELPSMEAIRMSIAAQEVPNIPQSFSIRERFFSLTDSFDLKDSEGKRFGRVSEKLISLTKSFTYKDADGKKLARARAKFFALGSTVVVEDGEGRRIGTINEDVIKSLFKVYTHYRILDAQDNVVASSEKLEALSTVVLLRDNSGRIVAELRRGFTQNLLRLTDRWDVRIYESDSVDPRLLVMIAAYKTSVDNDRRKEQEQERERQRQDSKD